MKVAIFTDTFHPQVNGVANTLVRLTSYLEQTGHDYIVFAPEAYPDTTYSSNIYKFFSLRTRARRT